MFRITFSFPRDKKQEKELARVEVGIVSRPRIGQVFWSALGTAMLMLGFAFFRQIAAWFLDGIAMTGADVAGIPFVGRPAQAAAPRQSLWTAPSPAQEPRSGGIDLSEFR